MMLNEMNELADVYFSVYYNYTSLYINVSKPSSCLPFLKQTCCIIRSKAREAIEACEDPDQEFRRIMSSIAASGAVAAVVLVDGADLYVASTGDCSVVLGSISENDTWIAKKLTTEHSSDNPKELKRIQSEHPKEKMRYGVRRYINIIELAALTQGRQNFELLLLLPTQGHNPRREAARQSGAPQGIRRLQVQVAGGAD